MKLMNKEDIKNMFGQIEIPRMELRDFMSNTETGEIESSELFNERPAKYEKPGVFKMKNIKRFVSTAASVVITFTFITALVFAAIYLRPVKIENADTATESASRQESEQIFVEVENNGDGLVPVTDIAEYEEETTENYEEPTTSNPVPISNTDKIPFTKFLSDNQLYLHTYIGNGRYIALQEGNSCVINESEILCWLEDFPAYLLLGTKEVYITENGFARIYEDRYWLNDGEESHTGDPPAIKINIYDEKYNLVKSYDACELFNDFSEYQFSIMWGKGVCISLDGKKICGAINGRLIEYDTENDTYREIYDTECEYGKIGLNGFSNIKYCNNDKSIAFTSNYYDGSKSPQVNGIIDVDGSGLAYENLNNKTGWNYQVYDGGFFFDEYNSRDGGNGVAHTWDFDTRKLNSIAFATKNESQNAVISKDGRVIVTCESTYFSDTKVKSTIRVYATDTMRLLSEYDMPSYGWVGTGDTFVADDGSWFLVRYYNSVETETEYYKYDITF